MMKRRVARISCVLTALAALTAVPQAHARYAGATPMPAARLIRNLSTYLASHPTDAEARYSLGRVYYAAFSSDTDEIPTHSYGVPVDDPARVRDIRVVVPHEPAGYIETKPGAKTQPIKQKIQYLGLALDNLTTAVKQRPKDARSHLTLGCAYEDGLALLNKPGVLEVVIASKSRFGVEVIASPADLTKLTSVWRARAAHEYLLAFDLSSGGERETSIGPSLAEEAGTDYLRIGDADASAINPAIALKVRVIVARLQRTPHAVTPIIFSMRSGVMLSHATQTARTVSFDLDGTGRTQHYSWLRPDTGILVWDPQHTGHIASGRQLFGSVTWWVFWRDGYHALDAQDDNRDGRLSGAELNGIGVWFDRNGDGVSEPGEVVSARSMGIASIACRPTGTEDGALASRAGIVMRGGATYTSWDWVAAPAKNR